MINIAGSVDRNTGRTAEIFGLKTFLSGQSERSWYTHSAYSHPAARATAATRKSNQI